MSRRIFLILCCLVLDVPAIVCAAETPLCPHCNRQLPAGYQRVATDGQNAPGDNTNKPAQTDQINPAPENGQNTNPAPSVFVRFLSTYWPVLILAAAVGVWFGIIQPRKRRRGLAEAKLLIAKNEPDVLPRAEGLLTEALTAGMNKADVAEARFQLAYTRARLGKHAEAEAVLADAEAAAEPTAESAYLRLWLLAKLRKHEEVERYYDKRLHLVNGVLDANRLAGITYLHLARRHWARKQAEAALGCFAKLRELKVLTEHIPPNIGDQRIVFGLMALFDDDPKKAREHFTSARETAEAEGRPAYLAALGLLLCTWRSDEVPQIDDELTATIPQVETAAAASQASAQQGNQPEEQLLLNNCRIWHLLSLLMSWMHRPKCTKLTDDDIATLNSRIDAAAEADDKAGDAWLIGGMLGYLLSADDPDARREAVDLLRAALQRNVNLPEVLLIVEKEEARERRRVEGLKTYLGLLESYLSNQEVPAHLRESLRKSLATVSRYGDLSAITIRDAPVDHAPSLRDLQNRVQLMRRHIHNIVEPRMTASDPQTAKQLSQMLTAITITNEEISTKTKELETKEQYLMLTAGEFLLEDESPIEQQPPIVHTVRGRSLDG